MAHTVKFWGVRGSFTTLDKDKIEIGAHSSCVEVRTFDNKLIIFDSRTGFDPLLNSLLKDPKSPKSIDILVSHFHWDHIISYLGFTPFFSDKFKCNIFGKEYKLSIEQIFKHIHNFTFWP